MCTESHIFLSSTEGAPFSYHHLEDIADNEAHRMTVQVTES